jgi:transposase
VARLDEAARLRLERWARSTTAAARIVRRSRMVLCAADGLAPPDVARRLGTTPATVRRWCERVTRDGPDAVTHDAPGRGRRPRFDALGRHELLSLRHAMAHDLGAEPSLRQLAARTGSSPASVYRALAREGVRHGRRSRGHGQER